jgi:hypothetical protein
VAVKLIANSGAPNDIPATLAGLTMKLDLNVLQSFALGRVFKNQVRAGQLCTACERYHTRPIAYQRTTGADGCQQARCSRGCLACCWLWRALGRARRRPRRSHKPWHRSRRLLTLPVPPLPCPPHLAQPDLTIHLPCRARRELPASTPSHFTALRISLFRHLMTIASACATHRRAPRTGDQEHMLLLACLKCRAGPILCLPGG